MNKQFTIIYTTYKNDLEWFKFSLLSLKKYLNINDILEILIYTHNVVENDVKIILNDIQFEDFLPVRLFPIHYNYHGYIKQMVLKANCYKDVNTPYIIMLDSDLILYKNLLLNNLLVNNKINSYFLDKKDDNNVVFEVWKNAVESSNKEPFEKYYMMTSFPFIFTTKSLQDADIYFQEIHNCNYENYCYNRCHSLNINIETPTIKIFDLLSTIFTEFEYLGFYCNKFSKDYNFVSYYEAERNNTLNNYGREYIKQFWSHGGITNDIRREILNILNIN